MKDTATQATITALNEYQNKTRLTASYPPIEEHQFLYPVLGLAGEVGELVNKVKKIFRDDAGVLTSERREALIGELQDVLWYTARVADELGVSLEEVASENIAKLLDRKERGVLTGAGDNR